jgi:hypothetical protein
MAIAAQQAPVGSVAHALHEQNQLTMMLQASLANMAPIQFGFGGFAQKSYPTYGPVMLGLGNLSRGNQPNETVQQISKSSNPDLEEIYAALAKQTEGMDVGSPSSPNTYSANEEITYEGMRKVLGGNGNSGASSEVDPVTKFIFDFFTEDIRTMLDPEATAVEKAMAFGFTFFKPAKLLDKAADVAGKAVDAVDHIFKQGKKAVDKFNIDDAYVKPKHLSTTKGNGAKFLGDSKGAAEQILKDSMKNGTVQSITDNGLTIMGKQSYSVIIDAGKTIGTKGENLIKVVLSEDGGMLSAYPIK